MGECLFYPTKTQALLPRGAEKFEMTETTHVCTYQLAKPREKRMIYHTFSPASKAERQGNTRYGAYAGLYAIYVFSFCWSALRL